MIFIHRHYETKQVPAREIPERHQHLLLPDAQVYYTKGLFGVILSQQLTEKGLNIWQHHFSIEQPCTLYAHNDKPVVIINYMLQGSPFAMLPGKPDTLLEEGSYRMFFVPRLTHEVTFRKGFYCCIHLNFNPAELSANLAGRLRLHTLLDYLIGRNKLFPYLGGKIDHETNSLLNELIILSSEDKVKQRHLAYKLLLRYLRKHHTYSDNFSVVENYLRKNLSESLKVKELARLCFKSESEFYRQFKVRFGTSPIAFLNELRLEEAMKLIDSTRLPIGIIAQQVGFNNQAFFNRVFKKHFGYSPNKFRKDIAPYKQDSTIK